MIAVRAGRVAALVALALLACVAPEPPNVPIRWLDDQRFVAEIQPILADRCANPTCHGRPERPLSLYAPGQFRADPARTHSGEPLTAEELEHNYTLACIFSSEAAWPEDSALVRKPLGEHAGVHHGGGAVFEGTGDRHYRIVLGWIHGGGAP